MAVDSLGNAQIDFVWGNMPLQPNANDNTGDQARIGMSPYPGDSMADYFDNPEAAYARMQGNGPFFSNQLEAVDNHVIALRHWANYPQFTENTGATLTVDWWTEGQPAYQFPNIIGLSLEEAVRQLTECGVDPAILVDLKFDGENPYDGNGGNIVNAPGADNPGVVVWKYLAPNTVIGSHWDGRPWYAYESEGVVCDSATYPSEWTAIDVFPESGDFAWWHSFAVLQTTDPTKDSFAWWN